MAARPSKAVGHARGLVAGLLVNIALLGLLAISRPAPLRPLPPEPPSPVVTLDIRRLSRGPQAAPRPPREAQALAGPSSARLVRPVLPPSPPSSVVSATAAAPALGPSPAAVDGASASAPSLAEKAAAEAVRHLLACAARDTARRRTAENCGETRRVEDAGHIDAITPEQRLAFGLSGPMRREALERTNRELQAETLPARGSRVMRYGCGLKHGTWSCSTY